MSRLSLSLHRVAISDPAVDLGNAANSLSGVCKLNLVHFSR